MIHRDIEKTLNLRGVQIERQNPVRAGRFQQRRHQRGPKSAPAVYPSGPAGRTHNRVTLR